MKYIYIKVIWTQCLVTKYNAGVETELLWTVPQIHTKGRLWHEFSLMKEETQNLAARRRYTLFKRMNNHWQGLTCELLKSSNILTHIIIITTMSIKVPAIDAWALCPVLQSMNVPVPIVHLTSPTWKQHWPNIALCWSPICKLSFCLINNSQSKFAVWLH